MTKAHTRFTRLARTAATFLLGLLALTALRQLAAPERPEIRLLTLDGVINPLTARYLERELSDAQPFVEHTAASAAKRTADAGPRDWPAGER